jgi:hypothetical protein
MVIFEFAYFGKLLYKKAIFFLIIACLKRKEKERTSAWNDPKIGRKRTNEFGPRVSSGSI